jgi:hypothetical protein
MEHEERGVSGRFSACLRNELPQIAMMASMCDLEKPPG